jgi:ribosomal protein L12E/L44/L45/RPP1/RPP2
MKKVLGLLIALGLMVSPVFAAGEQAAGDKASAPAAGEEKKPAKKATKAKKAEKKEEMKKEQKQ